MNALDEATRSLWMNVAVAPGAPTLTNNEMADVCVIGSGIAGLSVAYELMGAGLEVVVLDRGAIAGGMSARTSAHLTSMTDDTFTKLNGMRGVEGGKTFYQSHASAISRIEQIQADEGISCNFRRLNGYLFLGPNMTEQELDEECDATREAGMPVKKQKGVPFRGEEKSATLVYPGQAAFHPLRYLKGIADVLTKRGARLYANSAVVSVEERDGAVTVITESGARVSAGTVVVATNSPVSNLFDLHSKQAPSRTYVMAMTLPRDTIEDALYWDTLDPYHYVRLERGPGNTDYLLVGGADHSSGASDDAGARFDALEAWMRARLPDLGKVTHRWSGQVLDPIDYAAFSGRNPGNDHVFVHTGDSGQGLTHGVLGSLLISRLIVSGKADWEDFYSPARKPISAIKNFVATNIGAFRNFAEYVAPGELGSVDELKPGQGAIIREGLSKVAAYRDENGALHRRSAVCTHLGCHIHWNSFEKCWDCPCHGSQFDVDGAVLNAPAIHPLAEIEAEGTGDAKLRRAG
jgi:glycine/D-amino acid oxidase-like deaminating enzyme/nitrite reductase/ring-hydroxylating ferredoxin subunit